MFLQEKFKIVGIRWFNREIASDDYIVVTPCLDGRYSRGLLVFCVSRHSLTKEREGETQKSMDELHIACSLVFIDFMLEI